MSSSSLLQWQKRSRNWPHQPFLLNLPTGEWELKVDSGTDWSLFPPEEGKEGMSLLGLYPELRVRGGKQWHAQIPLPFFHSQLWVLAVLVQWKTDAVVPGQGAWLLEQQRVPKSRGMALPAPGKGATVHSHHPLHHSVVLGVIVPDSSASLSQDSQLG